jgi:hypothetical protein
VTGVILTGDAIFPGGAITRPLGFATLGEAAAGVEESERDYGRRSRTSRPIAEEYFHFDKVLTRLVENVSAVRT